MLASVLMPTYNHGRYIAVAIESFLEQTGLDGRVELLIGNDASSDDTEIIAREYAEKYPDKIRFFSHMQNRGLVANYAFLIGQARGKYLAVLESDDYWTDPLKLSRQTGYMEQHEQCGLVFTSGRFVNGEGALLGVKREEDRLYPQKEMYAALILSNRILAVTACFRKSLIDTCGLLDEFVKEKFVTFDLPAWLALASASDFYSMSAVTACYRVTGSSVSNNGSYEKRETFLCGIDKIISYTTSRFGDTGNRDGLANERVVKHMLLALAFGKFERYFYFCKQIKPVGIKWKIMRYCPWLFVVKKRKLINSGAVSLLSVGK